MKELTEIELRRIICSLTEDYNTYSELIALSRVNNANVGILEWNRGNLNRVETYLKKMAQICDVKLIWGIEEPHFFSDKFPVLIYKTVSSEFNP